jgi:hypothetical protein
MLNRLHAILWLLWLFPLANAQAQGRFSKAFARPVPNEKAIQIKWIAGLPQEAQYHVLRKATGEKTFTRLTAKPFAPVALPLKPAEPSSTVADRQGRRNYEQFRRSMPKTQDQAKFYQQLFALNVYTDNAFARAAAMYYKDETAVPGQTYQYAISAFYKGQEYSWALTDPVRAENYRPELAPVGLKIKQQDSRRVTLSWTLRPDVLAYNVYRRRGSAGVEEKINPRPVIVIDAVDSKQPTTQFTDTDSTLRPGETYYYRVAALDPFVNPGEMSQPVWLTLKDMEAPTGVTTLRGRVLNRRIRLSWQSSPSRDVAGYQLYRSPSMEKPFLPILVRLLAASDTAYTDDTAPEGSAWYYYLRTEDRAGNGVNTRPILVSHPDLTPPASPTGLTVQTDTLGRVTLTWRPNGESDLNGYFIYRALQNNADNYAQLRLNPIKAATFRDTLLRNNRNPFYYRVTAVDKAGNESEPALLTLRLPDLQPPAAPFGQLATEAGDSVRVVWKASSSEDVKIYHVLRRNEADPKPSFQVVGRTAGLRFADRNVPAGTYSYAVQAVDSTGNLSRLLPPQTVQVVGGQAFRAPNEVNVQVDERNKRVTVAWNQASQPTDFAGYRVLARRRDGSFQTVTSLLSENRAVLTNWEPDADDEFAVVAIRQTGEQVRSNSVKSSTRK